MNLTNIVLKTNLEKMPESCRECKVCRLTYANNPLVMYHYGCIYGMSVTSNVKNNTRHEDCPLFELNGVKSLEVLEEEERDFDEFVKRSLRKETQRGFFNRREKEGE